MLYNLNFNQILNLISNITKSEKRKYNDKKKTENKEKTKEKLEIRKKIKTEDKKIKLVTEHIMVNDMMDNHIDSRKWHTYIKMQIDKIKQDK